MAQWQAHLALAGKVDAIQVSLHATQRQVGDLVELRTASLQNLNDVPRADKPAAPLRTRARVNMLVRNYVLLALWGLLYLFARDLMHRLARWWRLSPEQFDAFQFGGILLYKMGIWMFFIIPCIALYIVGR